MIVDGLSWPRELGFLLQRPYRGIDRRMLGWMHLLEVVYGRYSEVTEYRLKHDPVNWTWRAAGYSRDTHDRKRASYASQSMDLQTALRIAYLRWERDSRSDPDSP